MNKGKVEMGNMHTKILFVGDEIFLQIIRDLTFGSSDSFLCSKFHISMFCAKNKGRGQLKSVHHSGSLGNK